METFTISKRLLYGNVNYMTNVCYSKTFTIWKRLLEAFTIWKLLLYENMHCIETFTIWKRLLYGNVYYIETFTI